MIEGKLQPAEALVPERGPGGNGLGPGEIPRDQVVEEPLERIDGKRVFQRDDPLGFQMHIHQLRINAFQAVFPCVQIGVTFQLPPVDGVRLLFHQTQDALGLPGFQCLAETRQ